MGVGAATFQSSWGVVALVAGIVVLIGREVLLSAATSSWRERARLLNAVLVPALLAVGALLIQQLMLRV
jgi:hypothetical protein